MITVLPGKLYRDGKQVFADAMATFVRNGDQVEGTLTLPFKDNHSDGRYELRLDNGARALIDLRNEPPVPPSRAKKASFHGTMLVHEDP